MPAEHVPRPKNAFMFFRSYYNANPLKFLDPSDQPHRDQNSVSCAAAAIWRSYTLEEKRPFQEMADREKERYAVEYPGYKYGCGGVKRVKVRRRSVPNAGQKVKKSKDRRQSVSRRRRVSIASTTASPPPPSSPDDEMEPPSPQSSSASPTPPPRTPSPMPDYHSDYIIGAEFDCEYEAHLDDELDIRFSHYSFSVDVKEEWDTYVDPVFPSYSEDPASFYAPPPVEERRVDDGEFTFFHEEPEIKVEEEGEEEGEVR